MPKYKLIVKVDSNDADYFHQIRDITLEEIKLLEPIIAALKAFQPYVAETKPEYSSTLMKWEHNNNWPRGEYYPRNDLGEKTVEEIYAGVLTPEQIGWFEDFLPYVAEGFHSIKSIKILEVTSERKVFNA